MARWILLSVRLVEQTIRCARYCCSPMINFGLGADSFIGSLVIQPDDKILLGGGFTHYDGAPFSRLLRIYGRAINGSGSFEFDSGHYAVNENGTNAVVTVRRRGGTSG